MIISNYNIISNSQYRFKAKTSIDMLCHSLYFVMLRQEIFYNGYIFVDLKKAFDMMGHTIMLEKIDYYDLQCAWDDF